MVNNLLCEFEQGTTCYWRYTAIDWKSIPTICLRLYNDFAEYVEQSISASGVSMRVDFVRQNDMFLADSSGGQKDPPDG